MAIPIWKDKFVSLTNIASSEFRILLGSNNDVIYSGKAFRAPGDTATRIRINDICADYLKGMDEDIFYAGTIPVQFLVQAKSGTSWVTKETVQFLNDWSYDSGYSAATNGMAFPINGKIDARMPILLTKPSSATVTASLRYKNGTTTSVTMSMVYSALHDVDFPRLCGAPTYYLPTGQYSNLDTITIGAVQYKVVTECAKYAVYYVNAYGGWDCFLIEGGVMETDNIERHLRGVDTDNLYPANRGIDNYVSVVNKLFTFHTGWLSDEQSSRMHHLINATEVYILDLAQDIMLPVTVIDTAMDHKTFENQGNKMVNYTFQVQVAQHRIRR